jgi:hypothetical protein
METSPLEVIDTPHHNHLSQSSHVDSQSLLTHTTKLSLHRESTTMAAVSTYSVFTSLPEELKIHVVRLVLVFPSTMRTLIDPESEVDHTMHTLLPVLLVNKEWRRLGLVIFYGKSTFALEPWRN